MCKKLKAFSVIIISNVTDAWLLFALHDDFIVQYMIAFP